MANPPPPRMPAPPRKPLAPWRVKTGQAIPWLAGLLLAGLLVQVWLAGVGLLAFGEYLEYHVFNAHLVELFPVLIVAAGIIAKDKAGIIAGVVLIVQMQAQYAFLASNNGLVNGLHPLNGVLMLLVTGVLLLRALPMRKPAGPA